MEIRGIIPALYTAFNEKGELDSRRQKVLVERLIAQGVHGLFAGGSTGEFPSLSLDERERLAVSVVEAAAGRVPVVAHVGCLDSRDSARLARHAVREGAAAVSSLPPFYYPLRVEEILAHFARVADAAAPLPFYAYHIPDLTGVPMSRGLLDGLLRIPSFAGLKWSDPDLFGLHEAAAAFGDRADVLSGRDELFLPALSMGARGAIGSTYNFLSPWFVAIWESFIRGDLENARRRQAQAGKVLSVLLRWDGALSSGKEATRWAGADCGEVRIPLRRYGPAERKALEAELLESGLPRGGL